MANQSITQLTTAESLALTDLVEVVRDPSGTPLSRKATVSQVLNQAVYKDIWISASAFETRATNGATGAPVEYPTNKINRYYYDFDAFTSQGIQLMLTMPEKWDLGTIKVKHKWTNGETGGNGGTVIWSTAGVATSNDDAIDAALGTAQTATDTALTDGDEMISPASSAITIGGTPALGDTIMIEVSRDVSDTYDKKARYWGLWIQYRENTSDTAAW